MTDAELLILGAKAAILPAGRNELSPRPLSSVTAEAIVDELGRIRVYKSDTGEVITIQQADGDPINAAVDLDGLKAALRAVLTEAGIATFS